MIIFDNVINEIYILIILLALLFSFLSATKSNYLIVIIIIILLSYGLYTYIQQLSEFKDKSLQYKNNTLDNDIKERLETNEKIFFIDIFPKQVKYLKKNDELIKIVTNLRFTIKFNKTRYSDIIINMNKLMKIYIYILSNRYDPVQYIPIFVDIRENIIEILYSLIIVIPNKLRHTYGVDTYKEINNSIQDFTIYSRKMLEIIENYAKIHKGINYIPDTYYKTYNFVKDISFP